MGYVNLSPVSILLFFSFRLIILHVNLETVRQSTIKAELKQE